MVLSVPPGLRLWRHLLKLSRAGAIYIKLKRLIIRVTASLSRMSPADISRLAKVTARASAQQRLMRPTLTCGVGVPL